MNIDEDRARAEGNFLEYRGQSYFFCDSNDREEFRKNPERYLKSSPAQRKTPMPMAGSQDTAAEHLSHDPAAVSKPRGAKAAPEAHDGMTMPAAKTPAAMPEMPDKAATMTEPKTRGMLPPATGAPGMIRQSPSFPGTGDMPMPGQIGTAPMPGAKAGEMFPPATGSPGMNRQEPSFPGPAPGGMPISMPQAGSPMFGPPVGAAIPGPKTGEMFPPGTGKSGMNQQPQFFPGPGPQETAPMSGTKTGGAVAPQPALPR
jgi:YHS domain-containing protein